MDVITTFLKGDLKEDVYVRQPDGFAIKGKENYVCKLNKALYGLKQSSRMWYKKVDEVLLSMNFKKTDCEPCLFISHLEGSCTILALYVDDILIFSNNEKHLTNIKKKLMSKFDMKDLGIAKHFLDIEIKQKCGKFYLKSNQY
jgi:hypothetical protein